MTTYTKVIEQLENGIKNNKELFVAVVFSDNHTEWIPVDRLFYQGFLKNIKNPESKYPCLFEVESDGHMYIHPDAESDLWISFTMEAWHQQKFWYIEHMKIKTYYDKNGLLRIKWSFRKQ